MEESVLLLGITQLYSYGRECTVVRYGTAVQLWKGVHGGKVWYSCTVMEGSVLL
jgi:hypothetical protein